MRFCAPHWEKLRAAIDERGLSHLVAQGGEQAARNLVAELREGPSIQTFDPLMAAHNAILANAVSLVGLRLLAHDPSKPDGNLCPICTVNEEAPSHGQPANFADGWIDLAADGAKRQADELLAQGTPDA